MTQLFRSEAVEARRHAWLGNVSRLKLPRLRAASDVPVWLQGEAAECALACLAMIAGAHGGRVDLATLRQHFPIGQRGASLADVVRIADALGLQSRPLRAEPVDLDALQTPCILHWEMNHFVVLVGLRGGVATIHDPARGRREVGSEELSRAFTGVALEITPGPQFQARPLALAPRVSLLRMLGRVPGLRAPALRILGLALGLEGLMLLSPLFLQRVVDDVLTHADRGGLAALGVGFALLVGLQAATAAVRGWSVIRLSAALARQWIGDVFEHLMRLPLAWFERRHSGDIWSRFTAVQEIRRALTTSVVEALLDAVMVLLTVVVMGVYSPPLAAIAIGAVALYAALRAAHLRPLRAATEAALEHEARQNSHFLESLRGMQAVKLFNAQALRQARFSGLVVESLQADVGVRRLQLRSAVMQRLVFGLERVAVVWAGAVLVMDGALTLGMLFAFLAFKEQFALRAGALVDKAVDLRMLRVQLDRLGDILAAEPEPRGTGAPLAREARAPVLELRGVSFRYAPGEPQVLRDLDLHIGAGESVAIVGPSGGGKSTLVKLLLGIHAPQAGEILVHGHRLEPEDLPAWRARVGAVMQDDALFAGTLADNIALFDPQPDLARVAECAQIAGLHDEIVAMPMGYQTLAGEGGGALSGGQKQRLLLARALYRRPEVLVLDEATSALDVEGERRINRAVKALAMTRIIVAHRPETIASAGRVIVLRDGRVAQDLRAVCGRAPAA